MSNCFLADNNEAPWAVLGDRFDTDTVTAQALSSRQARRTRGGDFHWPHVGTSHGHQRGLSHGHGHRSRPPALPERRLVASVAERAARQLERYRDDPDAKFDLPVVIEGSPLQRGVWEVMCAIPRP